MRTQYINNIEGTILEVEASDPTSYGVIYELLESMELEEAKEYDVWGFNGATLITFLRPRDAMRFKLSYPWSSGLKS